KNLSVGEDCSLNSFIHIWAGKSGVKIGNRVMIASHVAITSLTHDYSSKNMKTEPPVDKPIIIENDVWIGSHAVIMPGITIGEGAVVGAGSVVTKNVEPYTIVIGNPARFYKRRETY
ncbi:MAG: acyltransferase, partial [Flavobacterium sp.]